MTAWSNKSEYRRMVITDRSQNPHNFLSESQASEISDDYAKLSSVSSSCTDNFDIYILTKDNVVSDAKFVGEGCVISMTSTDFLLGELINKKIDDATTLIKQYLDMVQNGKIDSNLSEDLILFDEVHKQANRIPCASISARIILNHLEGNK